MNQRKLWNLISLILWVVQFAVEALTLYTISRLNMLPDQYLLLVGGGFLLLWGLMGLLLLPGKNNVGGLRRCVAAVLILVICVGCAVVSGVVSDVYETMHGVLGGSDDDDDDAATRSIYVLADDPAQTLADAANYSFAVVENFDIANVEQVLNALEESFGKKPQTKTYGSLSDMVDGFFAGEAEAIIVNEANLLILEAEDGYEDFHKKARLLCEIEIDEQQPPVTTDPTEPDPSAPTEESTAPTEPELTAPSIQDPEDITTTPFLVYVAGSDTRSSKLSNKTRNDVNILVAVNPQTKQILMINTPRDYFVKNPAGNGARDKLSHCGVFGLQNSLDAMSLLYGDRVDYYAQINFKGFETFIDAIGGVTVHSDVSFTTSDDIRINKGENYLNGKEALSFARERKAFADGDESRGKNQMKVVRAVIQKLTSGTTIITRYADILDSLTGMFKTNLTMDELSMLVKMQLGDMASWDILTYSVSGYGDMEICYSAPGMELWVMWPNNDMVAHATELIDRLISGEVLTQADLK